MEEGNGGILADGTLRYILSIEALLLREEKDERLDSIFELASLSISTLFSLAVREGGVGDELFFRNAPASLIEDEGISSEFCDDRGETRVATGWGTAMPSMSGFGCVLGVADRPSFTRESSLRDGEVGRGFDSQVFRENILSAPVPRGWDLTDGEADLSRDLPALSDASISFAETKRAADIRFFVFELARRKSSTLAFWTELLTLAGF